MATTLGNLSILPVEIRCQVWRYVLTRDTPICTSPGIGPKPHTAILTTCRGAHKECMPIFYESNTFTVLIHQSRRLPWGMTIARSGREMIKSVRIEVMIDHKGPTTTFLGNIAQSVHWVRSIGPTLQHAFLAIYEGEEHSSDDLWMPGVRNQVVATLLNFVAPLDTIVIPTRLLLKLKATAASEPATDTDISARFEALVKMVGGREWGGEKRLVAIKGRRKVPGWAELLLRGRGA